MTIKHICDYRAACPVVRRFCCVPGEQLMRYYYSAQEIRDAEAPLLAALPDGALMRRAAYGLATVVAEELSRRAGVVAGRSVCALVGSGDNGGDALWALMFLRRRGVAVSAILLNPERVHHAGLTALRKVGGRVVSAVPADTDLVLDGVWVFPVLAHCDREPPRSPSRSAPKAYR